jgi:murein DD-endopeptidase MepM/ murein hydrolase activator NlpD
MSLVLVVVAALSRAICYLPPVDVPIVEPFVAAPCTYCAGGHRGVEYIVPPGIHVHAAAGGTVIFDGVVVGTRYLVVLGDDGLAATYGKLAASTATTGRRIVVGDDIGVSGHRLYFGLRNGDDYIDPETYLAVTRHRPRLIPSNARPGRPSLLLPATCPAAESGR